MVHQASGRLNDSSPAANLASVNIKGKWAAVPFPRQNCASFLK
jgi:hypothetical protein